MRVNCGSRSPIIRMRTLSSACRPKATVVNTQKLQEITFRLFFPPSLFFLKGRSRVWLMSRQSWTEWLANKTPWFQLTTYHRRRTKREGSKTSFIVYCFITLGKNRCTCEHKKQKKWPLSQRLYQSAHTKYVSDAVESLRKISEEGVLMRL